MLPSVTKSYWPQTPSSSLEFVAVHYGIASQFWYGVYLGVMCNKLPYSVKKADVMLGTTPIIVINILVNIISTIVFIYCKGKSPN